MRVVKPPHAPQMEVRVFLAGSIEMGAAEDWQTKVQDALSDIDCVILNPRRDDWDSSWAQDISDLNFTTQVNWELGMLDASDVIFMYFDPATKSPISLLELGLYANSNKLIVCCPEGFWRRGNVQIVCSKFDVPLYSRLDYAIDDLVSLLQIKIVK